VEDFYRERGNLIDVEIVGGIPQTMPRLLELLRPYTGYVNPSSRLEQRRAQVS
jgi:hypothetical protein